MQPKVLTAINTDATATMDEVARQLAITIATAVEGDGDGAVLIGPASAIMDDGKTLGLTLMLARPPGPMLAMQLIPNFSLAIDTAAARSAFRDAICEELKRHCVVRSFPAARQLIEAARSPPPKREAPRLLLH
jgi:predicted NBD/HSP70 family sugar kinase